MTPMMEQYFEIKNQYKDYLLFYRLGDFYEMFFDDAIVGSRELELTLTGRDCGEAERAPMYGVPFHSAESYIARLIEKGYKVAICEQMEDPATAKGLVKRDVIRIITPGTVTEASMLPETRNNYLASVFIDEGGAGVCFADISTAQIFATSFDNAEYLPPLLSELGTYAPREVLVNMAPELCPELADFVKTRLGAMLDGGKAEKYDYTAAKETAVKQFSDTLREGDIERRRLICALGALLDYISETQKTDISYIKELNIYENGQYMQIDLNTRRNLELTETMRAKEKRGSLLGVLDKTSTAAGARLLRQWVEHPLLSISAITRRQAAVGELFDDFMLREDLRERLESVLDIERLVTRIVYGTANARDLRAVSSTLSVLPDVCELLSKCKSDELSAICSALDPMEDIVKLINDAIVESPPALVREGGMIVDGYNADVDRLRSIISGGKGWIEKFAEKEREATGIKSLRVGYNRVFGYYIEVTRSLVGQVPEDRYIRKQTLANCERYITQELKDTEAAVLGAGDRLSSLEYELFSEVRTKVAENASRLQRAAALLARIDAYVSLASVAAKNNYTCPHLNVRGAIEIRDGRHPVVELFVKDSYFVPNDTSLDMKKNRVMIITDPNMAGKSTYMRQVALIAVMTQIGSFVPAADADMCITDRVFTRVGASDDLASGQSTFMLEMNEVANILKNATKNSLIIYDEVGRGTSTFDGMSIARAIVEYTQSRKVGAKTLFATHYHELTVLEDELDGVVNYNIAARKRGDTVIFLRKIVRGSTDDSYGIEVAKLAGLPNEVIKRAKEVLASVEAKSRAVSASDVKKEESDDGAISLEECMREQVIDDLRAVDVNTLSPIEAMNFLFELQKKLK